MQINNWRHPKVVKRKNIFQNTMTHLKEKNILINDKASNNR